MASFSFIDPNGRCLRYTILIGLCYINIAQFFCIEVPSGLQSTVITTFKISSKQYNMLFSSYTWPEIIMSTVGGVLTDRVIGTRAGYLLFVFITVLGQGLFAAGAFLNVFEVVVAGRFIFGCGVGTMKSLGNVYVARWFKNKEIVFAMSILFCSCRLGASIGLIIPRLIYERIMNLSDCNYRIVGFTFLVGFGFAFSSLLICIATVCLDYIGSKKLQHQLAAHQAGSPLKRSFKLKDLKDFSLRFWLCLLASSLFFSVLYLFVANGQLFFKSKFELSTKQANIAGFLVFIAPVLVTPVIGYLVDIIGYNTWWGIVGALLGMAAHFLFNAVSNSIYYPYLLSCLFSVAYSFFGTAIFVLPSFIVQEHQLTTAFNMFNVLYSIIFTCSSIIAGSIIDYSGYIWLEIFFFFSLFLIFVILIVLTVMDLNREDKKMNRVGWWLKSKMIDRELAQERRNNKKVIDYLSGEFVMILPHHSRIY